MQRIPPFAIFTNRKYNNFLLKYPFLNYISKNANFHKWPESRN